MQAPTPVCIEVVPSSDALVNPVAKDIVQKPKGDKAKHLRGLYLFAGPPRKLYILSALEELLHGDLGDGTTVSIQELDILRDGEKHDLSNPELIQSLLDDISRGALDFVIASPPCCSW